MGEDDTTRVQRAAVASCNSASCGLMGVCMIRLAYAWRSDACDLARRIPACEKGVCRQAHLAATHAALSNPEASDGVMGI